MTTRVDDTGLNYIATYLATQDIQISAHTADPTADGSAAELPTGGGRNYSRHLEAAGSWAAEGGTSDNNAAIDMFTPVAAEAGTTVTHLGIRIGAARTWYGRIELVAPVTLVEGRPFRIAEGTIDLTVRHPA